MTPQEFQNINKLVKNFSRHFCYRYRIKDIEELEGYLMEKMILIMKKFDKSRNVNFYHYAKKCLNGYSFNFLRDKCRIVKIPRKYSDLNLKFQKFLRKSSSPNDNDSKRKFCEKYSVDPKELEEAIKATTTSFSEINNYIEKLIDSNSPDYNPFCKNYLRSIPQRDIEILQDIFVLNKKPERVFLNWGLSPCQGYKLIKNHVQELLKIRSD